MFTGKIQVKKINLKILKHFIVAVIFCFQLIPSSMAQSHVDPLFLDSLEGVYGVNKEIPSEFRESILLALSHFPELKNVPIEFAVKEAFPPLSATPKIPTLFLGGNKRKFHVLISERSNAYMEPILLKNLPFNARVGVLGHELSHVVDYLNKSWMELIAVALNYGLIPSYHAWMEKKTDLIAIDHGLGWELYSYYKFARSLSERTPEANWANDFYLHYNEVLFEMQKRDYYNPYFIPNTLFKSRNSVP